MYTTIEQYFHAHMVYRKHPELIWENVAEWNKKGWEKFFVKYLENDGLTHYPGWAEEQWKKDQAAKRPKRILNE